MELLRRTKVEEELRKAKHECVLNIQPLAVRSSLHSSSYLECVERKAYNGKIEFVHMKIHDINIIATSIVEFLRRSKKCWCTREQIGLGATSIKLVFIEES